MKKIKNKANSSDSEAAGLTAPRQQLETLIARFVGSSEKVASAVPGLGYFRRTRPTGPVAVTYEPSLCVMVRGSKRVMLGDDTFIYDPMRYLITSVRVPAFAQVLQASEAEPCLGLQMKLDLRELSQMMVEGGLPAPRERQTERGMATGALTLPLVEAFVRLLSLQGEPEAIPVLAPAILKEVHYRLLTGEQGMQLRQIAAAGSQSRQVAKAVQWLQEHFQEELRVESLAELAGMSLSGFHSHFKSMTALSPLQYQKQLRLLEARRLMLAEGVGAAVAAGQVGYESPSQFSREYRRHFGAPPKQDAESLTAALAVA